MDVEALDIVASQTSSKQVKLDSKSKSRPIRHRANISTKKQMTPSDDLFGSMELMTVDDLLKSRDSSVPEESDYSIKSAVSGSSIKTADSRTSRQTDESIHTYKESIATQSIDSEVKTHSTTQVLGYASDFDDTLRETESIITDDSRDRSRQYSRSG